MADTIDMLLDGLAHQRAGRPEAAEAAYRDVLAVAPDDPRALHYLGLLALGHRRESEALDLLERARAARPDHDPVQIAYGRALMATGRAGDAVSHFAALAKSKPLDAEPAANLALAHLRGEQPDEAIAQAEAALRLDGSNPEAWFARGTALAQLRRPADAVAALEQAIIFAPEHAEAHLNLGNAWFDLDRREQAEMRFRHAIALDPSLAEAHASLGCLLSGDGRLEEAVAVCDRAVAIRPDFAQAHWNQSFAHMLAGDYAPGWEKYEWRKRHDLYARHLMTLPGPEWQGEALMGRTILVRAEQGLGDTIQFARYLPLLVASGADIVLACLRPLARLLHQISGLTIVATTAECPDYDVWIDQMSLPRLFGTRVHSIPSAGRYLAAEDADVVRWRQATAEGPGMRIGIVWAGNPAHSNDLRRSMPIEELAPLVAVPNCRFVSLQVGNRSSESRLFGIADLSCHLHDLAETAALIETLDLVVSVDSCVAHLAGALGKPVWVMLPFAPDWRWMIDRADSPWYGSMRLFRQRRAGDWSGPVGQAAAELAAWHTPVSAGQAASFATSDGAMRTSFS